MTDAPMQFLHESAGRRWYFAAPGNFARPGLYFWDGKENVHIDDALNATTTGMEAPAAEPVAYVPMHPRLGPLWADTYDAKRDATQARSSSYPPMALYTAPPTGEVKPEAAAWLDQEWKEGNTVTIRPTRFEAFLPPAPALSDEQIDEMVDRHYRTVRHPDSYSALRATVRDCIQAALAAQEKPNAPALAHPAPAGWMLVPIEPTDEMLEAAAIYRQGCQMLDRPLKTSSLYAAMLAAAPNAQEPA